jgi:hypothetical protein
MKFEWKKKIKALGKGYLRRTTTGNCPIETACGHAEAVHKTSGFLETSPHGANVRTVSMRIHRRYLVIAESDR